MDHRWNIQIVCADAQSTQQYRNEFKCSGHNYRLFVVRSADEARRSCLNTEPSVILFDASCGAVSSTEGTLESMAGLLIEMAPVVVVAAPEWQSELTFLITSGAVDFVARSGNYMAVAVGLMERRLRLMLNAAAGLACVAGEESDGDFGEILRHEVNNPLTGILGNAEMLLARRDRLPPAAVERVETIAELAVRLRETVRRLSHTWDEGHDRVGSA